MAAADGRGHRRQYAKKLEIVQTLPQERSLFGDGSFQFGFVGKEHRVFFPDQLRQLVEIGRQFCQGIAAGCPRSFVPVGAVGQ
jgi:hypothetical protein